MSKFITARAQFASILLATCVIAGCGGGGIPSIPDIPNIPSTPTPPAPTPPQTYSVSVAVSGLAGSGLTLQDNAGDDLTATTNGNVAFATKLTSGANYTVSVKTQPTTPTQTCAVANGTGTISGANVTNVAVTCTTNTYKVGVAVTGLNGTVVLQDNGGDDLSAATNSNLTFATAVASGHAYAVTIKSQPTQQTCAVTGGSGTVTNSDISSVTVNCHDNQFGACALNGNVVTHSADITTDETWTGAGTVHMVTASINIVAPATVTVQPCAIVKLKAGVEIVVRGSATGATTAKFLAAGNDPVTGLVYIANADAQPFSRIRGFNKNSLIELDHTIVQGGGAVGGAQLNAVISMTGSSTLPDPVLKVNDLTFDGIPAGGIYLSDAAFTTDSGQLTFKAHGDYPLAMPAMALGSIPPTSILQAADRHQYEVLVVENANIFDNLTISTTIPIHFKTDSVHVGGLAPTFVPNLTLTLQPHVWLEFERASTAPTLVTFGDVGQPTNKNAALVVNGSAVMTSATDTPQAGDWAGIWLATANGSHIDGLVIQYAGGDPGIGPASCGPIDPSIHQRARNSAAIFIGDGSDAQYVPPANLITNSAIGYNAGNYDIDSVWTSSSFGPSLTSGFISDNSRKICSQNKNGIVGGCVVGGVDQSGCLP